MGAWGDGNQARPSPRSPENWLLPVATSRHSSRWPVPRGEGTRVPFCINRPDSKDGGTSHPESTCLHPLCHELLTTRPVDLDKSVKGQRLVQRTRVAQPEAHSQPAAGCTERLMPKPGLPRGGGTAPPLPPPSLWTNMVHRLHRVWAAGAGKACQGSRQVSHSRCGTPLLPAACPSGENRQHPLQCPHKRPTQRRPRVAVVTEVDTPPHLSQG